VTYDYEMNVVCLGKNEGEEEKRETHSGEFESTVGVGGKEAWHQPWPSSRSSFQIPFITINQIRQLRLGIKQVFFRTLSPTDTPVDAVLNLDKQGQEESR
jgi:hypothetical protein